MNVLPSISFLIMCTVFQLTQGRATEVDKNVGIVGGHSINIEDAPYMAGFVQDGEIVCSGSIVHRQFILTSASCAKDRYPISTAHVGSRQARKGGFYIDIDDMVCHEHFDKHTLDNNVCLLKLRTPLSLEVGRNEIATVELPDENINTATGTMVNVTGWGSISTTDDQFPINLQQATISVLADESCFPSVTNKTENMLCAGSEGRDTCTGDGGGPLTQNNVQLGILSYGSATCGGKSIYTRVSKYVTWIQTNIQNNL